MKRILLVDDEPEFLEMLQMRLEANGYEVQTATDGAEGFRKAKEEHPNLILLDVMMPGMDGFEVLSKLRACEDTKYLPVVMLTAKRESKFLLKSQELRATDYLMKPCDSKELLQVVRKHAC
jgi:adenylate cyclase